MKQKNKPKIVIRLEKNGNYIEKKLTPRMVCDLFDLQYVLTPDNWKDMIINHMDKRIAKFFYIISHIDDAMHEPTLGHYIKGRLVWKKKKDNEWLHGKPKWKKIK